MNRTSLIKDNVMLNFGFLYSIFLLTLRQVCVHVCVCMCVCACLSASAFFWSLFLEKKTCLRKKKQNGMGRKKESQGLGVRS